MACSTSLESRLFERSNWAEGTVLLLGLVAYGSQEIILFALPVGFYLLYKRVYDNPGPGVRVRKGGLEGGSAGFLPHRLAGWKYSVGDAMVAPMGKTKRTTIRREFETNPFTRHQRLRRCDDCGAWFGPDEISAEKSASGRLLGWFCRDCIEDYDGPED